MSDIIKKSAIAFLFLCNAIPVTVTLQQIHDRKCQLIKWVTGHLVQARSQQANEPSELMIPQRKKVEMK